MLTKKRNWYFTKNKVFQIHLVLLCLVSSGCAAYHRANLNYLDKNIFAKVQKNIFKPKCGKCHKGLQAPHGVNFATYEKIFTQKGHHKLVDPFKPTESGLIQAVVKRKMPPKPHEKLSEKEILLIKEWICRGAPKKGMGKEPSGECMSN